MTVDRGGPGTDEVYGPMVDFTIVAPSCRKGTALNGEPDDMVTHHLYCEDCQTVSVIVSHAARWPQAAPGRLEEIWDVVEVAMKERFGE